MKRKIALWQFAGLLFVVLGGTLLHFVYDWTGRSLIAAPISAVNESTWEHMKLMFFPMLLFALIEHRPFRSFDGFWCVKLIGTSIGLSCIPMLFYTLNGALGKTSDWINIALFLVSATMALWVEKQWFLQNTSPCKQDVLCLVVLCLIAVLFMLFTFVPPQLPLFRDPLSETYGITTVVPAPNPRFSAIAHTFCMKA